jgi:HlyD family secretion protein
MKKKLSWMRIMIGFAVVGAAVYLAVLALRPETIRVETASVVCGPMRVTLDADGKTRARDRFVIGAPVAGRLARIALHRGDAVQANEVIARIDPVPLMPLDPRQQAEARARVASAEQLKNEAEANTSRIASQCEQGKRDLHRAETLSETGDISRQEFERIRNDDQVCRQQLEAAKFRTRATAADVELARAALIAVDRAGQSGTTTPVLVRATVAGRVLRIAEESERVVQAGTPLIELSNPSLEIVVDLLSQDAVKVAPGAPVIIEGWGGDHSLPARVRLIEPSAFTKVSALGVEEQRVNLIADFLDPSVPLGDAYRIEAKIVLWEKQEILKVPISALFREGDAWRVFVVENGIARSRPVEVDHRNALEAEIIKGLREGETVIVHPPNALREGLRVSNQQ